MTKTLAQKVKPIQQKPEAAAARSYEAGEFDADTDEERPVALLAQRRRQSRTGTSSAGLLLRESVSDTAE